MNGFESSQYKENLERETEQELGEGKAVANWPIEKIMRQLVIEGKHLDQDAVYETLIQELPEEEIVLKIKEDYTREVGEQMVAKVRETLGDDYVRLLIDPSIGTRVDELIAFTQLDTQKRKFSTPMDLRRQFKESLGYKKVYRVVALTEQELENVRVNGFIANYYRSRNKEDILLNEDGYESIEYNLTNLIGRVNVHAGGFATTKDSMLISTSDFLEMAQYAAFVQIKDNWAQREASGQKLYLIPIEIEEFRNIRYGRYLPHHIKASGTWHSDEKDIPYNDPGIESFVEFQITPKNILADEIKQIDITKIPNFEFIQKEK